MAWNNGLERKKFEAQQKRLEIMYRAVGMTEEQIHEMYQYDLERFNSERAYFSHNQQFPESALDDDDESVSPLNKKCIDILSEKSERLSSNSRYWWLEDIENPSIESAIQKLGKQDIEVITLVVFEGYSQSEVAEMWGVTRLAITQRIRKIKKYFSGA